MIKAIRNILTVSIVFLVLILLPKGFWHSQFYGMSSENFELQDIELNPTQAVSVIANNYGNINISAWDKADFLNLSGTVHSREKIEVPFEFGCKTKKHAAPYLIKNKNILYIVSRSNDQQILSMPTIIAKPIEINITPWLIAPSINFADLKIKLPQNSLIHRLVTAKGHINIENFDTNLIDATTDCGNITISGKIGLINCSSKKGNISIKQKTGSIIASTNFGNIDIDAQKLNGANYITAPNSKIDLTLEALEPSTLVILKSQNIILNLSKNLNIKIIAPSNFSTNNLELKKDLILNDHELGQHVVEILIGKPESQIFCYGNLTVNY